MRRVGWIVLALAAGCGEGRTPEARVGVKACQAYARAFAEGAATRCARGTFDANLDAFRVAAGVGGSCERVLSVRDDASLREACLPWIAAEADCALFDEPRAYLDALPAACRGQLELVPASPSPEG